MSLALLIEPASATPAVTQTAWLSAEVSTEVSARTPAADTFTSNIPSLQPLGRALQQLVGLPDGWDSYGAVAPVPTTLTFVWWIASELVERGMPVPQVFPTRGGGIQLEWHLPHASLEWEIDASLTTGAFIFDDHRTGERLDGELLADLDLLSQALSRVRSA